MRAIALVRVGTEGAAKAEDYAGDYHRRHPDKVLEIMDVDSREGADLASLYGVIRYPAILVLGAEGRLQQIWQDEQLPSIDELDAYLLSA